MGGGVTLSFITPYPRLSAVPSAHLEGKTHTDGAGGALLSTADHIGPQVPPQQRHPPSRPQTRYGAHVTLLWSLAFVMAGVTDLMGSFLLLTTSNGFMWNACCV